MIIKFNLTCLKVKGMITARVVESSKHLNISCLTK